MEQKIAKFHGREDAILYGSCFDANGGVFEALLSADDAIISDQLNHASIIDGIRLSKARKYRYKHAGKYCNCTGTDWYCTGTVLVLYWYCTGTVLTGTVLVLY